VDLAYVPGIVQALEDAKATKFDFVCVPIAHPRYNRDFTGLVERTDPWTRSDLLLNSSTWSSVVVGKISPWIELDSCDEEISFNSRKAFKQELAWATHLSLPAILLPSPSNYSVNYAQCINQALLGLSSMQVWVKIPLVPPQTMLSRDEAIADTVPTCGEPWEWWNSLRVLCEHHHNLGVVLELTADVPDETVLKQWLGEPIRAVILPTSIFLSNKMGYPTLSKKHQTFLLKLFRTKTQFILRGVATHKNGHGSYLQYLMYLWNQKAPLSEQELQEAPYLDYLQAPLQPLMDNLESQTYEVFERDPIKYRNYQEAVQKALADRIPDGVVAVVMVVGAGRGPLVRASLAAAKQARKELRVYAVEKNPNAVVTLKSLKASEGWDNVTVVDCDMRDWKAPEEADILVSELLGSFGDNELSPECLDGAQKFLKASGISIPCEYTSYISPISSSKLYNEVKHYDDLSHFETAYVVKIHNANILASSKPCFTFVHPNVEHAAYKPGSVVYSAKLHNKVVDNSRYTKLVFEIPTNTTLHGFAGYFDCTLYGDVHISINPATFSDGMFSWFPLLFPLRVPMHLSRDDKLEVHFWRNCTKQKVWYEWCVTAPEVSPIHNPNGRSYWIGL
jgi:protein arginine N-methyltransferase 5